MYIYKNYFPPPEKFNLIGTYTKRDRFFFSINFLGSGVFFFFSVEINCPHFIVEVYGLSVTFQPNFWYLKAILYFCFSSSQV